MSIGLKAEKNFDRPMFGDAQLGRDRIHDLDTCSDPYDIGTGVRDAAWDWWSWVDDIRSLPEVFVDRLKGLIPVSPGTISGFIPALFGDEPKTGVSAAKCGNLSNHAT